MFYTATVRPTRSGPRILYNTSLRDLRKFFFFSEIMASAYLTNLQWPFNVKEGIFDRWGPLYSLHHNASRSFDKKGPQRSWTAKKIDLERLLWVGQSSQAQNFWKKIWHFYSQVSSVCVIWFFPFPFYVRWCLRRISSGCFDRSVLLHVAVSCG